MIEFLYTSIGPVSLVNTTIEISSPPKREGKLIPFLVKEDGMARSDKPEVRQIKNAVVDARCKLTPEECKDANCPVHGNPEGVDSDEPHSSLKGADKLEAAEAEGMKLIEGAEQTPLIAVSDDIRSILTDAKPLIQHLSHPNDFSRNLVERIERVLNPPVEMLTVDEARRRFSPQA